MNMIATNVLEPKSSWAASGHVAPIDDFVVLEDAREEQYSTFQRFRPTASNVFLEFDHD